MYWGTTSAQTFAGTCERTKYNGAPLGNSLNDNVWTGASFAIASGYKFTVSDIQVDIAGQDYQWKYKLEVVNGDGTVEFTESGTIATPRNSSKKQVTATGKSIVLTGTSYVKLYYCLETASSDSKYINVPELYLTGTVSENVQSKYTIPSITQGAYNQAEGTYSVTLSVQNEEDGTINYTVGAGEEVTGAASGTVINVAPSTTITAYVTGATYDNSDNKEFTTSAAPKLATPTKNFGSYNLMKNLWTVTLAAAAGDISYSLNSGSVTEYSEALQLAPGTTVVAYATQTNMTQSDNLEFTVPAAPVGGSSSSPTTSGTYANNTSYNMGAITIPGACIAGQISSGTSPINGSIKTRCNQSLSDSKTGFYVNVNSGYTITGIQITGCSNKNGANNCTAVYIDGKAVGGFSTVSLPLADNKEISPGVISVTGINATNKIEFAFENTEQAQMNISITYSVNASASLSAVSGFTKAFATFCAPQNFTITGATAYKAQVSGDALLLNPLSGIIPKATGVIIAGEDASSYTLTYVSDDATADVTGNELLGVSVRTLTSTLAGSSTFLALNSSEAEFQEYTGTYFPANKAYLLIPPSSRSLTMTFADDETTLVKTININNDGAVRKCLKHGKLLIETPKGVYTVQGVHVK